MARTSLKVFVDTKVFYSALISPAGPPAQVHAMHEAGEIHIVVSRQVIMELIRTVRRKSPHSSDHLRELLISSTPEVIENAPVDAIHPLMQTINAVDAPLVAAAIASGASYLVTGDKRLVGECAPLSHIITVVSPREFLEA